MQFCFPFVGETSLMVLAPASALTLESASRCFCSLPVVVPSFFLGSSKHLTFGGVLSLARLSKLGDFARRLSSKTAMS